MSLLTVLYSAVHPCGLGKARMERKEEEAPFQSVGCELYKLHLPFFVTMVYPSRGVVSGQDWVDPCPSGPARKDWGGRKVLHKTKTPALSSYLPPEVFGICEHGMNKSDFTLERLGGGGRKQHPSASAPWGNGEGGEEGESQRTQMAPGPFAAEKLTNTKRLSSLFTLPFY